MNLAQVAKRLRRFENHLTHLKADKHINQEVQVNFDILVWLEQLHGLAQDVHRIKQKADAVGDDRTALAAIGESRRIVELSTKLTGQLEEKTQMNILHVEISPETAERIARTYLTRHRTLEPPHEKK
jgi:hypothetical protein